mmetsp:Transcript_46927/g.78701  ORF Transcript_46927/g.78701 Transcript_46927/m.78701 type:complete len:158 (-) Transcript_46927:214-687(-)
MTAVATRQAAAGTPSLAMLQIDGPLASVLSLRLPAFGGSSVGTLAVDVLSQSAGASSVDVMHVVVMSSGDVYCEQKDELPMLAALSVAAFRGSLEHDSAAIFSAMLLVRDGLSTCVGRTHSNSRATVLRGQQGRSFASRPMQYFFQTESREPAEWNR